MWSAPRLVARQLRGNTIAGLCFRCYVVRAEEIEESRISKLAAVGVQKSIRSTRSTTERTRMRTEPVIGMRWTWEVSS
jgi:hypothetical protein